MTAAKTAKTLRILLGAMGVGVMAYGIWGFTTAPEITARPEIGQWLIAGVIAHDALLAPTVFLLGAATYRVTGARMRGRLAALLLIGGSLALISLPALTQKGHNPNHTVLPLDYARNLGVLLAALAAIVVLLSVADARRARRRRRRLPAAPEPTPEPPQARTPELEPELESDLQLEPELDAKAEPIAPEPSPPQPTEPELEQPPPTPTLPIDQSTADVDEDSGPKLS